MGLVVYVGKQTKIAMNMKKKTIKITSLERYYDLIVGINILFLFLVIIIHLICWVCLKNQFNY